MSIGFCAVGPGMFVRPINFPVEALAVAITLTHDFAWLDSADGQGPVPDIGTGRGVSILAFDSIETRSFGPSAGPDFLEFLSSFSSFNGRRTTDDERRFAPLWLCYISYETYQFNPLIPLKPTHQKNYPLAVFRKYDTFVWIDHAKNEMWFVSTAKGAEEKWQHFESVILNEVKDLQKSTVQGDPSLALRMTETTSRSEYNAAIASIKTKLLNGDYYELNYTIEHEGLFSCSPIDLYLRLRKIAHAPMMAFFDWPEVKILSASPERFFKIESGSITTNPIKGTIKRGTTSNEDEQNKKTLLSSEKDQAELLMVTDMLRNDIGRVCEIGSVKVDRIFGLHTFSHYHHLVSGVVGRLRSDVTLTDVFCALFPGGSITGAPKIAVMKHIDKLEHRARGVYTGAVGYIADNGVVDFNIPIRTITIEGDRLSFAVGGGIVADSTANGEYEECLVKAQGLLRAIKSSQSTP